MMKAILGSALGGVVAGTVALMATAQGRAPDASWNIEGQPASPYVTVADTRNVQAPASAPIECEPHQEAVLQRSIVGGRQMAQVSCAPRTMPAAAYTAPVYYAQPGYAQPVAVQPDIVERPVARTQTVRPRAQRVVTREEGEPKRSWKKSALVIGGAAGAGAGVGAIAGGKKGALIGAAIGGGSGAVYEVIKRK